MRLLLPCLLMLSSVAIASNEAIDSNEVTDLIARGQMDQAYEVAQAWAERAPNDADAAYWAGATAGRMAMQASMFGAMGYAKESRKGFERALELDPKHEDAAFSLMQFHMMAPGIVGGDKDEAQAIGDKLIAASPVLAHRVRSQRLGRAKDSEGALREQLAALKLSPANPDLVGFMISYYLDKKDNAQAKALLEAALAAAPESTTVRYQLGKFAAISGENLEQGLAALDGLIALKQYPEGFSLSGAHWRRGQILKALGRNSEAVAALEASLKIDPELKPVQDELKALKSA